jgi:pyruvate kinase
MMLKQPNVIVEPKSAERTFTQSHASTTIPAGWQMPLPTGTKVIAERGSPETTTTLRSSHQPVPTTPYQTSRKTKIIATLNSASESGDVLRRLLEAGVSVFRLDLTTLSRAIAPKVIYALRSISTELHRPVSLLVEAQRSPGRAPDATVITESDWADVRFGLECGMDWLAVSAGCNGAAVRQLRQFLAEQKRQNIGILACLESPFPPSALDQIIQDADGLIFGGFNPASECPDPALLHEWRLIVQKCINSRKLAVIATGLNERVASALSAQPDALLLVEETGIAGNPLQRVQALDALIRSEEFNEIRGPQTATDLTTEADKAIAAAVQDANATKADVIVVLTRSGTSAALCAALRPRQTRVFVFTPDARLARRLRLRYALEPIVIQFSTATKATITSAERILRERKWLPPGARVVFLTDALDEGLS